VWPDPTKLEAISNFPEPGDLTSLCSFLGLENQLGVFILDLPHVTSDLGCQNSVLFKRRRKCLLRPLLFNISIPHFGRNCLRMIRDYRDSVLPLFNIVCIGHILSAGMILPKPGTVAAVAAFPASILVSQLQEFMGLANFYQPFVPYFTNIANAPP
ncbi:hypothetical protein TCAL_10440, partial [Tigriopus californicus]